MARKISPVELKAILAVRLRALMDARPDLDTQVNVSKRTGASQSTIQRVLAKDVHTNLDVIGALGRAFGVPPHTLIEPISSASSNSLAPSYDELELLQSWRKLKDGDKHRIMAFMAVARVASEGQILDRSISLQGKTDTPPELVAAHRRASARPITTKEKSLDEPKPKGRRAGDDKAR